MATTIGRLAEEIKRILDGGDSPTASNISYNEIKIAIGQVFNSLLKVDYLKVNGKLGETIPNGAALGLYENIEVVSSNGKSKSTLPVKPMRLPRNMGVWAIYPKYTTNGNYELDKEFIPLQMGHGALIKSQPMISDLLGQVGYENFGMEIVYTKDIKSLFPDIVVAMRLVILDVAEYGDWDVLPILPEMEWQIKNEVVKLYMGEPIPDKIVDSSVKEQKQVPVREQQQP